MTDKKKVQQEPDSRMPPTPGTLPVQAPETPPYPYDAFISYRHVHPDMDMAKTLHTALETYRIPKQIAERRGGKRLGRIFRDQEELPVSENLSRDILHALQSSRYLIVVCSPSTPQSKWCVKEIETFKEIHGHTRILPFLIAGEPSDSFPPALYVQATPSFPLPDGAVSEETEPLAADIRAPELRGMRRKLRQHEILRLIAPILGVSYDTLRQRERERITRKRLGFALAGMVLAAAFGLMLGIGLNRIEAERQRTLLEAQKTETERARADKLLADSQLAEALADAAIRDQKQKTESERQRADLESRRHSSKGSGRIWRARRQSPKGNGRIWRSRRQRRNASGLRKRSEKHAS